MSANFVVNPKTNRPIAIGGRVYKKLLREQQKEKQRKREEKLANKMHHEEVMAKPVLKRTATTTAHKPSRRELILSKLDDNQIETLWSVLGEEEEVEQPEAIEEDLSESE